MAYNIAYEETVRAPRYETEMATDKRGRMVERSTRYPTGEFVETTYKIWRCSGCRAWFVGETPPEVCGNKGCGSR